MIEDGMTREWVVVGGRNAILAGPFRTQLGASLALARMPREAMMLGNEDPPTAKVRSRVSILSVDASACSRIRARGAGDV